MLKKYLGIVSIIVFLLIMQVQASGFLKTQGKNIVNEQGDIVLLRGMGLGGWMLQEGYMMQTSDFASAQHEIKSKIMELVGEQNTESFYAAWRQNHFRKADMDSLAHWGFNSIRLPMHYNLFTLPIEEEPNSTTNTWLSTGFELTDSLVSWCAANHIYLILDLHAAPGGQGYDKAISDYDDSKPSLWESAQNRSKTVALWRKLAERYANEPWVGGYDLLNETNWNLPNNQALRQLYRDITTAIREVDSKHIIFIEGNWFANDFTNLTPAWDTNMAYSFHKYWTTNKQSDIQWMLNIRNQYNVPLWCGESGENSNAWFTEAIQLFESHNIGWSWWPLKKIESISCPASIKKTDDYQTLLNYWKGQGGKPSASFAFNTLMGIAENAKIENCEFHKDVIDAMFRQIQSTETIPYSKHAIPGKLPLAEFDLGRAGAAYSDKDIADYHGSSGTWTAWNTGWALRNDGVDIEPCTDSDGQPYDIGWTENDEWLKYTVQVSFTDSFDVTARIASANGGGKVQLDVNGEPTITQLPVPQTSGWQDWETLDMGRIFLPRGLNTLKLSIINNGFNINQLAFKETGTGQEAEPDSNKASIELYPNFPNPFKRTTTIKARINSSNPISVNIYNITGKKIRTFFNGRVDGQTFSKEWDGQDDFNTQVASGIYFVCLQTSGASVMRKMILIR